MNQWVNANLKNISTQLCRKKVIAAAHGQDPMGRVQYLVKCRLEDHGAVVTTMGYGLNQLWAREIMPAWETALDATDLVLIVGQEPFGDVDLSELLITLLTHTGLNVILFDPDRSADSISRYLSSAYCFTLREVLAAEPRA